MAGKAEQGSVLKGKRSDTSKNQNVGRQLAETRQAAKQRTCWLPLLLAASFGVGEPSAAKLFRWDARQVRLDVEDRSSVEHIDTSDMQGVAFAADEFDDRKTYRVRTAWGSRREDAVRTIVRRGRAK